MSGLVTVIWLATYVPALAYYLQFPHAVFVVGQSPPRPESWRVLISVSTVVMLGVCTLAAAFGRSVVRPRAAGLLIAIVPLLSYAFSASVNEGPSIALASTLGPALLAIIALYRVGIDSEGLIRIGVCGAISVVTSLALLLILPANAVFVDRSGLSDNSVKALIGDSQLAGIFGHSNTLGMVSVIALSIVSAHRQRLVRAALVGACIGGVVMSASRTSITALGVLAGVELLIALRPRLRAQSARLLWILQAIVPAVPLLTSDPSALSGRGLIWRYSIDQSAGSLAAGLGPNWFAEVTYRYNPYGVSITSGHNLFVHVLVTTGLVGMMAWATFIGSAARSSRECDSVISQIARRYMVVALVLAVTEYAWSYDLGGDLGPFSWIVVSALVMAPRLGADRRGTPEATLSEVMQ